MRRNSGFIGSLKTISDSEANGIHDLYDQFNHSANWPKPLSGTITPSTTNVTEGNDITFSVSVSGNFTGTLYYTINDVTGTMSTDDFSDSALSGSFSVTDGSGSFVKSLVADGVEEGEEFSVSLRSVSTSGDILDTTTTITVTDADVPVVDWTDPIITSTGFNGTNIPNMMNNYYRRFIVAFSYTLAEMEAILGSSDTTIYGLRYFVNNPPTYQPYPNYAIGMKNGAFSATANPGSTGYTIVSPQQDQSFTGASYKEIIFDTPFVWSALGGLAIVAAWGQVPTSYSATGTNRIGAGNLYYSRTDSAGTYTINVDTFPSASSNIRPVLEFKLTP